MSRRTGDMAADFMANIPEGPIHCHAFDAHAQDAAVAEHVGGTPAVHVMPLAVAMMAVGGAMNLGGADVDLGRYLASDCLTCHRAGPASNTLPDIFGMAEPRFTTLIKAYRNTELPNPVMPNIASRLTDEEIAALASYFAQAKPH